MLNLPILKYRRLQGDMTEMYKIITNKLDSDVTLKFNIIPAACYYRGNIQKIRPDDVTIFVNFPFLLQLDAVVEAESVNSFKGRLDRFSNDQEVKYNCKADIKDTGSRTGAEVM